MEICKIALEWLYKQVDDNTDKDSNYKPVQFSIVELLKRVKTGQCSLFINLEDVQLDEVEEALFYMSMIRAMKLEGGFLVLYNGMDIRRLKDNKARYKRDDYRMLDEFYKQNYFQMDYKKFVAKYFKGERLTEIQRNVTPGKYEQLFGQLSMRQMEIISDKETRCIVVAAGPGSGKTKVLVHKLASLLLLEDVKHEQLLMLTFSRAAATEFKQRLMKMIFVIDEEHDLGVDEHDLVKALMEKNEEMRVIAVGDDDQNIFGFRGSNSCYMLQLAQNGGRVIEMTENYRSTVQVVDFANAFVKNIRQRMKSTPIISMSKEKGWVGLTRHHSQYLYHPIVDDMIANRGGGTSCVLTQTNEEAAIVMALLRKNGVNSKLIHSLDGFPFCNLAEIRYFLKQIDKRSDTPLITDESWEEAKQATFNCYERSTCLSYVKRCLEVFEQTNKCKYRTDFWEFVFESSVEDFCEVDGEDVVVSTIHKAKGHEFDDVYMLISDNRNRDDEVLRKFYVGMTRAKKRLFIHVNCDCFLHMPVDKYVVCQRQYDMPDEIVLQLSHKDVFLEYARNLKNEVLALRSGDALLYKGDVFYDVKTNKPVAQVSARMKATISYWEEKGYVVRSASVRFIVAWRPKNAKRSEPEIPVVLADMVLERKRDVDIQESMLNLCNSLRI